jgi:hypothetical protein
MNKSFAALMLGYLYGDATNTASVVDTCVIKLTNVDKYAPGSVDLSRGSVERASLPAGESG